MKSVPINHFARAKEIWVDPDDAGHYIAYMNNIYTRGNGLYPNARFITKDGAIELQFVNEEIAIRYYVGNLIDSAGYRRNLVLTSPILKEIVKGKPLSYMSSSQGKMFLLNSQNRN